MDRLLLDPHVSRAEEVTLGALLRCCIRELGGPRGQVGPAEPYLLLEVAGTLIRVRAHGGIALRFEGRPEWLSDGSWLPLTSELLVELAERELRGAEREIGGAGDRVPGQTAGHAPSHASDRTLGQAADSASGLGTNDEFGAQIAASRDAIAALLAARARTRPPSDPWLTSEQSLVDGHPFHPSPKAHTGSGLTRYAPEARAEFPLRLLGVRADLVAEQGDTTPLDGLGAAPRGYTLLPAHPWQVELVADDLRAPLADGRLLDLGYGSHAVTPTSSVRTVYDPVTENCLKFSLDVRITNCVRKNAWYELIGAVELTDRLRPVFGRLAGDFPGTRWLPEPGYRSAALGTRLFEALGVILRSGPWRECGPGVTPILAGALAATTSELPEAVTARRWEDPHGWWRAYVERVAPPVLDAYFTHGVVLEPHVQNVLVGFGADGLPAEAIFRDLEGTKLVAGRHDLAGLPDRVAQAATYDPARGWNRVVYCLVVNHLAEVAATVAEVAGTERLLDDLWHAAHEVLEEYAQGHGRPGPLAELLGGAPLPAKANLGVRWSRSADRAAGYTAVASPLAVYSPRM
ncbi:IucA/IucC family protein [Planotetraspora phitsanulokensis]|uniref:Iron transporter n=1 Tax=Planotetraspora phitsanulokensis TaxID=575192 RepID=A0A8J3U375_9ACTN|nr:IucA/IucC family protein [Planotetraspora phitsanulokensis]GII37375.1 iron transporter [Planotetraspora phitsanulokensis]